MKEFNNLNLIDKYYNEFLLNFNLSRNKFSEDIVRKELDLIKGNKKIIPVLLNIIDYNRLLAISLVSFQHNKNNTIRENYTGEIIDKIKNNPNEYLMQFIGINMQIFSGLNYLFNYLISENNTILKLENMDFRIDIDQSKLNRILSCAYMIGEQIYLENDLFNKDKYEPKRIAELMYYELNSNVKYLEDYISDFSLDNLIKEEYGLSISEIYKLLEIMKEKIEIEINNNKHFIYFFEAILLTFEKDQLYYNFFKKIHVNYKDFEKFFEKMKYSPSLESNFKMWGKRNLYFNRQPIIQISEKYYITTPCIFIGYLLFLLIDISDRQTKNNEVNRKIHSIMKINDKKFEKDVYNQIKELTNFEVLHGIEAKDLSEIDILVKTSSNLYIIECKNSPLKVYPKEINKARGRAYKINNQLNKKIIEVTNNKEKFLSMFNEKDLNKEISGIYGIIIFANMPIEFSNNLLSNKVYSISEFIANIKKILV